MASDKSQIPGLALVTAIAIGAYQLQTLPVPPFSIGEPARHPIDAMLIAIAIGVLIRNTVGLPARFVPGVRNAAQLAKTLAGDITLALLFRRIATLELDVPVGTVDEWRWTGPTADFAAVCERLNAPRLLSRARALAVNR